MSIHTWHKIIRISPSIIYMLILTCLNEEIEKEEWGDTGRRKTWRKRSRNKIRKLARSPPVHPSSSPFFASPYLILPPLLLLLYSTSLQSTTFPLSSSFPPFFFALSCFSSPYPKASSSSLYSARWHAVSAANALKLSAFHKHIQTALFRTTWFSHYSAAAILFFPPTASSHSSSFHHIPFPPTAPPYFSSCAPPPLFFLIIFGCLNSGWGNSWCPGDGGGVEAGVGVGGVVGGGVGVRSGDFLKVM